MLTIVMNSNRGDAGGRWNQALDKVGKPNGYQSLIYPVHCIHETARLVRQHARPKMILAFERLMPSLLGAVLMPNTIWESSLSTADRLDASQLDILDTVAEVLEAFDDTAMPDHTDDDVEDAKQSLREASQSVGAMVDVAPAARGVIITRLGQVYQALDQLDDEGPRPVRDAVAALEGEVHMTVPAPQRSRVLRVVRKAVNKVLVVVGTAAWVLTVNAGAAAFGIPALPAILDVPEVPAITQVLPGPEEPVDGVVEDDGYDVPGEDDVDPGDEDPNDDDEDDYEDWVQASG